MDGTTLIATLLDRPHQVAATGRSARLQLVVGLVSILLVPLTAVAQVSTPQKSADPNLVAQPLQFDTGLIEGTVSVATPPRKGGEVQPALVGPDPDEYLPLPTSRGGCESYLDSYRVRVADRFAAQAENGGGASLSQAQQRGNFDESRMWWDDLISRPLGFSEQTLSIDVDSLTVSALASAPRIQALLAEPQILQCDVTIADAEFDPTVFLDGKFVDTNDPVGNELTTGDNSRRFTDQTFSSNLGVRRKTRKGGRFEVIQRGGFQENNSLFLNPNPQGTTRLEINYTQPLWKDAGTRINRSRIMVAQLQANQAASDARDELESHLLEVTQAYWDLYRFRSLWLQQQKLVGSTRQLHELIESRQRFDAGKRHVLRARAALARRSAGLSRTAAKIRDAQSRLRMLVASDQLIHASNAEWTTAEQPVARPLPVSIKQSVIDALEHRADISNAIQAIHEVTVRLGVAKNQVLPQLDMLLGTYVAGLDEGRDPLGAFANQFSEGRPGFFAGLAYEIPVGNRAARSRLNRNRWELHQVIQEFRQTTEKAITETEIAARETQTAYQDLLEKKIAVDATESEVAYLTERYRQLPGQDDSLVLLVDNLLDAQERLAEQERELVDAQVNYAISWVMLRKSTGTLLRFDDPIVTEVSQ
jgi:outer membrane protein TolC